MTGTRQPKTDVSLSDILERGRLRTKVGSRVLSFTPSGFDHEILRVTDASVRHRIPTGFLLPSGGTRVGVVVAAAMLIQHYVEHGGDRSAKIALVTRNTSNRAFYRDLHIAEESLVSHYPLEIVLPGGAVETTGKLGRVLPGRFRTSVQLDRVLAITDSGHDGVVVESEAARPEDVARLLDKAPRTPLVYLTSNPYDPVLEILDELGATWAWGPAELAELAHVKNSGDRTICVEADLLARSAHTTYEVVGPDEQSELDKIVPRLFDVLRLLGKANTADKDGVKWAWAVTHALSSCVVPRDYYERWAAVAWKTTTLADAPARAQAFAENTDDDEVSFYWESLAGDFADALDAMQSNVKPTALLSWVKGITAEEDALVIVRNRTMAKAVEDFLQDSPGIPMNWGEQLTITWFGAVERGVVRWGSKALLPGTVTYSRSGLLNTPPVDSLTVLSHGPWETGRIVRQINQTTEKLRHRLSPDHRDEAHRRIFGEDPARPYPDTEVSPDITHGSVDVAKVPDTVTDTVWNPFNIQVVDEFGLDSATDHGDVGSAPSGTEDAEDVVAISIKFETGAGYFDPDTLVSRIRDGEEKEVAAKSLQPGDKVILVDNGARTSLFDLIASALEELPEFETTVLLVREWQSRARAALELDSTYETILHEMQKSGSRVTTAGAVSHWVHGRVLGPKTPEDIRRFGAAIDDKFLVSNWKPIGKALETLRKHRRSVGRQLARVVEQQSYTDLDSDGYFDGRLGIHMSDLAEVLTTHTVASVDTETRTVPAHLANVVLQSTDETASEES